MHMSIARIARMFETFYRYDVGRKGMISQRRRALVLGETAGAGWDNVKCLTPKFRLFCAQQVPIMPIANSIWE